MSSPLDHPVWTSRTGAHAGFAERHGQVLRYRTDVAPFLALPPEPDEHVWDDLAGLAGPDGLVSVGSSSPLHPPADWEVEWRGAGVQLVDDGVQAAEDPEAVRLTPADVPEMLDLVARAKPGPFLPRTIELGTYLGIRRGGRLVAMAGERLRPPGWTEISAVCTDAGYRGQGFATRLVLALAAGIRERGDTPLMHALADNTNAIRLYESLGFRLRGRSEFLSLRVPLAEVA